MKRSLPAKHIKIFKVAYQPVKKKTKKEIAKNKKLLLHYV